MVETLFPDPFLENQNWEYLWINKVSKVLYIFLLFAKLRTIESDWNYSADHLLLPQIKLF